MGRGQKYLAYSANGLEFYVIHHMNKMKGENHEHISSCRKCI